MIIALLFGVLTDYLVFFVSGFRARLRRGASRVEAASAVTAELLPVVMTAALMIAGATMTLSLSGVDFLSVFGPAMAISVLVAAVVSLTFLPACLAIFGRVILWPHRLEPGSAEESGDPEGPPARGRIVGLAARHPILVGGLCLLALLAGASGLRKLELGNPIIRGLPTTTQTRQGFDEATQALGPGVVGPSMLVVEGTGDRHRRARPHGTAGRDRSPARRSHRYSGRRGGSPGYRPASSSPKTGAPPAS